MKTLSISTRFIVSVLLLVIGLSFSPNFVNAQAPNIGVASQYAILSGDAINTSDIIYPRGDVGSGSTIGSGIIATGTINQYGNGNVPQALSDLSDAIDYCDNLSDVPVSSLTGQTVSEGT